MNPKLNYFISLQKKINKRISDRHRDLERLKKLMNLCTDQIDQICDHDWQIDRTVFDPCRSFDRCIKCNKLR